MIPLGITPVKAKDTTIGTQQMVGEMYAIAIALNKGASKPATRSEIDRVFQKKLRNEYGIEAAISTIRRWERARIR